MALRCPALVYDLLVSLASWLIPPGKSRRRLARKFGCETALVADTLVCYATIYGLAGVIILLSFFGLAEFCAD